VHLDAPNMLPLSAFAPALCLVSMKHNQSRLEQGKVLNVAVK